MSSHTDDIDALLAARGRREMIRRMQYGRRRAALRRLLDGCPRPGDVARAGPPSAWARNLWRAALHGFSLQSDVVAVAAALLAGGWHGTYNELMMAAEGL